MSIPQSQTRRTTFLCNNRPNKRLETSRSKFMTTSQMTIKNACELWSHDFAHIFQRTLQVCLVLELLRPGPTTHP